MSIMCHVGIHNYSHASEQTHTQSLSLEEGIELGLDRAALLSSVPPLFGELDPLLVGARGWLVARCPRLARRAQPPHLGVEAAHAREQRLQQRPAAVASEARRRRQLVAPVVDVDQLGRGRHRHIHRQQLQIRVWRRLDGRQELRVEGRAEDGVVRGVGEQRDEPPSSARRGGDERSQHLDRLGRHLLARGARIGEDGSQPPPEDLRVLKRGGRCALLAPLEVSADTRLLLTGGRGEQRRRRARSESEVRRRRSPGRCDDQTRAR
mmetsp:Transcript_24225/g.76781  ORF Transcript_24225/g.76781 Transcript_24225/m.76781 type:complete len:265 (+) Transcript_24225:27-821(+)